MVVLKSSYTVIAFDTSTDMLACALAAWTPGEGSAEVRILAAGDHLCRRQSNVELTSTILETLEQAGMTMADVDAVLVGRGPGSFTGVRIGIATAKGIACGLGCMLHGTSTLDAVAWRAWLAGTRGKLAVADDAMRGEVYPGIYVLDDEGPHRTFGQERVEKAEACATAWAERPDKDELVLTGDGLKRHRAKFEATGFARCTGRGVVDCGALPAVVVRAGSAGFFCMLCCAMPCAVRRWRAAWRRRSMASCSAASALSCST